MLDITLALIFSQLPHPECWMPRSHWRLSIAFGLLCLLGSWCSPGSRVCVVCGVCLQRLLLFMYMCNWPLAAEVPVHCEVYVTLWSFYCLYKITTVLIVQYCSPPLVAQTLLIFSTQIDFNPSVVYPEQGG